MARPLRIEYPDALYHVMARGDGGKMIFESEDDVLIFMDLLGQACERCRWQVHAWVLMGNHYHLLVETPDANLVTGMKWLMGVFSQGWNRRRQRRGHVFQGRYKAVPINAEEGDGTYYQVVADYIHLNPVRAGLAGGRTGKSLLEYSWSSLKHYRSGRGPEWLEMKRVLAAFELANNRRGRLAYVKSLELRSKDRESMKTEVSEAALRRGWYLGDESYRDKLLQLVETAVRKTRQSSVMGRAVKALGEQEAERLLKKGLKALELPTAKRELAALKPGHASKALLAKWLRAHTTVSNRWIAERLEMGSERGIARITKHVLSSKSQEKAYQKLVRTLQNED